MNKLKILLLSIISVLLLSTGISSAQTICAADVYLCTDGKYVGRSGPSCTFDCSGNVNVIQNNTGTVISNNSLSDVNIRNFCNNVTAIQLSGERSENVRHLQNLLRANVAYYLSPTGFYGPVTIKAVKAYQIQNEIRGATGYFGPVTLRHMRNKYCGGSVTPTPNTIPPTNPNTSNGSANISMEPISSQGNNVTIGWATTGVSYCSLNGEAVQLNGNKIYTIYVDTNFMMRCTDQTGKISEKSLTLRPNTTYNTMDVPTGTFISLPENATVGSQGTLNWNMQNATYCTLNGAAVNYYGSQTFTFASNSQGYTLICYGPGGSTTKTVGAGSTAVITNFDNFANREYKLYSHNDAMVYTNSYMRFGRDGNGPTITGSFCNLVGGNYLLTNGSNISMSRYFTSTQVACDRMTAENDFIDILNGGSITATADRVTITKNNKSMIFTIGNTTSVNNISTFDAVYSNNNVNLTWNSNYSGYCSIGYVQSLPSVTAAYETGNLILLGSNFSANGTFATPFIGTTGFSPARMILKIICGDQSKFVSVESNINTSNNVTFNAVRDVANSNNVRLDWSAPTGNVCNIYHIGSVSDALTPGAGLYSNYMGRTLVAGNTINVGYFVTPFVTTGIYAPLPHPAVYLIDCLYNGVNSMKTVSVPALTSTLNNVSVTQSLSAQSVTRGTMFNQDITINNNTTQNINFFDYSGACNYGDFVTTIKNRNNGTAITENNFFVYNSGIMCNRPLGNGNVTLAPGQTHTISAKRTVAQTVLPSFYDIDFKLNYYINNTTRSSSSAATAILQVN